MSELIDFKNLSNINVYYEFDGVQYTANIENVDNRIKLKINMTGNLETWRSMPKIQDIINVKTILDGVPITLFNCYYDGSTSIGTDDKATLYTYYSIDRILYDYKLNALSDFITDEISVKYSDLEHMTECKNYELDVKEFAIKPINKNFKINVNFGEINIEYMSQINEKGTLLEVKRITEVNIKFIKKLCINEITEKTYMIKNLFMILLKRNIFVENIHLIINSKKIELYDCLKKESNYQLLEKWDTTHNYRCMKLEKLSNLNEIFEKFCANYEKLYPILELYYNVVQSKIPDLTRLVNCCVMIEYYSRQFDNKNSIKLTKMKHAGTTKKVNDAEYFDRVKSLLININSVYNFSNDEIEELSDKIKDARTYFIHFQKGNKFKGSEEFYFNYFIEDVILINIYLLIGIKLNGIPHITFEKYIYSKENLL